MSKWQTYRLGEVADVFDGPHATPKKTDHGPWFLSISSLSKGRLDLSQSAHLSEEDFLTWTRRVAPQEGDVLFSYETRLGEAAIMPAGIRACLGRRMGLLRPKRDRVDPHFLLYAYLSPEFQEQIRQRSIHGATVDRIPISELSSWEIRLPGLRTQKAISRTLSALDDKIALNDRIISTCDELRGVLFSDFLTSRANAKKAVPLSSVAEFINGRAFTKNATGSGRMVIRIAEINSGPGGSTVYNDIEVPEQHLVRPGDILFAWSGSLTVARWFRDEAIVNQHIFKVIPRPGVPTWLVFELIARQLPYFQGIAADKATTMGHIQRRHLDEPVEVPHEIWWEQLDVELRPLWDRALVAERENLALAALRDTLLPGLMSGEIRVRGAEQVVEAAT